MTTDTRVDARQLLQRGLQELAPGEDLDEALLRACKALHPQQALEVFGALGRLLDSLGRAQGDRSRFDTVTRLAASKAALSISVHADGLAASHDELLRGAARIPAARSRGLVAATLAGGSLDELPPEAQARLRALLGGDPVVPAHKAPQPQGPQQHTFHCRHCGHAEPGRFARCPHCGKRPRAGLLRRLLGP